MTCDAWYWISTEKATVLIGIKDGTVAVTPPYCAWSRGKKLGYVMGYWRRQGAWIRDI